MHPSIGAMFVMRTRIPQPRTQEFHINKSGFWHICSLMCQSPQREQERRAELSTVQAPALSHREMCRSWWSIMQTHRNMGQPYRERVPQGNCSACCRQGGCDPHAACVTNSTSTRLHKWSGPKPDVDLSSCLRQKMLCRSPQDVCVIHSIVYWWLPKGWSKAQGTFEEPGLFCSRWFPCHTGGTMRSQRLDIDKTLSSYNLRGSRET